MRYYVSYSDDCLEKKRLVTVSSYFANHPFHPSVAALVDPSFLPFADLIFVTAKGLCFWYSYHRSAINSIKELYEEESDFKKFERERSV